MTTKTEAAERNALKMSHIWLYSKDTGKSIQFYRDILGFGVVQTFPDGALLQGGSVLLGIHREEGDRKSHPGGTLLVLHTSDINGTFEELKRKGIRFLKQEILKAAFGQVADFRDPDGYLLEIWQPPQR